MNIPLRIALFKPSDSKRTQITNLFRRHDYMVREVNEGKDILHLMRDEADPFDLVIVPSLLSGEINALAKLAELKADPDLAHIPVVTLLLSDDRSFSRPLYEAGCAVVLQQPFDVELTYWAFIALRRERIYGAERVKVAVRDLARTVRDVSRGRSLGLLASSVLLDRGALQSVSIDTPTANKNPQSSIQSTLNIVLQYLDHVIPSDVSVRVDCREDLKILLTQPHLFRILAELILLAVDTVGSSGIIEIRVLPDHSKCNLIITAEAQQGSWGGAASDIDLIFGEQSVGERLLCKEALQDIVKTNKLQIEYKRLDLSAYKLRVVLPS